MGRHTKEQRSYNMSSVKSKNTSLEIKVFTALEGLGLAFEKHYNIIGKPDIAFPDQKIAVFIDSDFWHGWKLKEWIDQLTPFWAEKFAKNKKRDRIATKTLRAEGWKVIRIWDHQIEKNLNRSVSRITQAIGGAYGQNKKQ